MRGAGGLPGNTEARASVTWRAGRDLRPDPRGGRGHTSPARSPHRPRHLSREVRGVKTIVRGTLRCYLPFPTMLTFALVSETLALVRTALS